MCELVIKTALGNGDLTKNHEFVINNFKHIISNFPEWKLQIIGDGPLRKKLEKIIYRWWYSDQSLVAPMYFYS